MFLVAEKMEAINIPCDSYKLGFIGAGKLAESIAKGVVKSGVLPPSSIRTAHSGLSRKSAFQSFGVKVLDHNHQVVYHLSFNSLVSFICQSFSFLLKVV